MSNITDYQMEQILFKLKANKNSKTLQNRNLDLLEKDPEIKALDEFITRLRNGEVMADIPKEENLEDFKESSVILPELGKVSVYEPSEVSENRKKEAYKKEIEEEESEKIESEDNKKAELAKYSVIPLKDEDGNQFDLIIDQNGNDLGKITYDEKGKPSFEMSQEVKSKIDTSLAESKARMFVEESTIQEEFYLKNIDTLTRAIEEGKVVPQNAKEAGERAIAAKNIKDNKYTEIDTAKALTLSLNEIEEEKNKDEEAKSRMERDYNNKLETPEKERDIVLDREPEKEEEKEYTKNIQTQPKLTKPDSDEKEENEEKEEDNIIPQEKRDEIEEICKKTGINLSSIKAVLIIEDASTLADCTENSHINRTGNEVTVVQFSDVTGKDKYTMIQDGIELGGDAHDDSFSNLIEPLHRTTGRVKRVEDDKTYLDYSDSTGEINRMQLKRIPQDMSLQEKEAFKEKLQKDLDSLNIVRANDPENLELIDKLEIVVYEDFKEVGLTPPESIKEDAEEEKIEPEENVESKDDDDCYDEIGRRTRPH